MTDHPEPQDDAAPVVKGPVVEGEIVDGEIVDDRGTGPTVPEVGYTTAGVPTFDHVRETIEGRVATASGAGELDREMPEVRSLEQQEADRDAAGRDKLEEIRRSLRGKT